MKKSILLKWITSTSIFFVCSLVPFCQVHALEVAALVTKESEQASQFIGFLREENVNVHSIDVSQDATILPLTVRVGDAQSVLIIGQQAFEYYLDNQIDLPALVLYVKSSTFYHLTRASVHLSLVENKPTYLSKISAIFSDPSPKDQMTLIKRHYSHPAITTLLSPLTYYLEDELRQSAKEVGMRIDIVKVEKDFDINRALNTLPPRHALLALPDHYIYNSLTLKNIIISTYRSGRPIFGFSGAMVKAGAVASVIADSKDLAKQSIRVLDAIASGKTIRQYSRYGSVVVNDAVARSLNIISLQQESGRSR